MASYRPRADEPILLLGHLGLDSGSTAAHAGPLSGQFARSSDGLRDAVRLVERARLDARREDASARELHESIRERNAQAREYHELTAALLHSLNDAHAERTDAEELLRLSAQNADGARARAASVEAELAALAAERQAALDAAFAAQRRTVELREYVQNAARTAERARADAHDARTACDAADAEARELLAQRDAAMRDAAAEEAAAVSARARAARCAAQTDAVRAELDALRARRDAAARAQRVADDAAAANESASSRLEAEAHALARALSERRAPWAHAEAVLEDAEARGVALVDAALSAVAARSGGGATDGALAAARAAEALRRAQAAIDEASARVAEEEAHVALAARRLSALCARATAASSALRLGRAAPLLPASPATRSSASAWRGDENAPPLTHGHAPPVRGLFPEARLDTPPAAGPDATTPEEAPSPRPQPCRRRTKVEDHRGGGDDAPPADSLSRSSRVAGEPVAPAASPFRHVMRNLLR